MLNISETILLSRQVACTAHLMNLNLDELEQTMTYSDDFNGDEGQSIGEFHPYLRAFLRRFQIGQNDLSETWNVSQGTVSAYLNGRRASLTSTDWHQLLKRIHFNLTPVYKKYRILSGSKEGTSEKDREEYDREHEKFVEAHRRLFRALDRDESITHEGTEVTKTNLKNYSTSFTVVSKKDGIALEGPNGRAEDYDDSEVSVHEIQRARIKSRHKLRFLTDQIDLHICDLSRYSADRVLSIMFEAMLNYNNIKPTKGNYVKVARGQRRSKIVFHSAPKEVFSAAMSLNNPDEGVFVVKSIDEIRLSDLY